MPASRIGPYQMQSLEVKSHLVMSGGANFEGDVNLASATVGGMLSTEGSSFKGDVNLASAAVGSNLSMIGASFKKGVNMDSLEVKSSLFMSGGANFEGDVNLRFAKVGSNLDFSGTTFHHDVDLTGTFVTGDLRLGTSSQARPQWENGTRLVLRNVRVNALQDRIDAWPGILKLDGFVYNHLGGVGEEETAKMTDRDTGSYEPWIKRDPSFSPQPYQQLAKVFREIGFAGKANDILFTARAQERDQGPGLHRCRPRHDLGGDNESGTLSRRSDGRCVKNGRF